MALMGSSGRPKERPSTNGGTGADLAPFSGRTAAAGAESKGGDTPCQEGRMRKERAKQ